MARSALLATSNLDVTSGWIGRYRSTCAYTLRPLSSSNENVWLKEMEENISRSWRFSIPPRLLVSPSTNKYVQKERTISCKPII